MPSTALLTPPSSALADLASARVTPHPLIVEAIAAPPSRYAAARTIDLSPVGLGPSVAELTIGRPPRAPRPGE